MQYLINISDLVEYVGPGSRKYIEGQKVANSNHMMYVGITAETEEQVDILGLCLQNSDLFGNPHKLNATILIKGEEEREISCKFSCIGGGLGICKHVVGLLVFLIR
ncbi:hypothetical protein QAD02_021588 [Eretmocerus hayati]|uniref:Uncharacterized protein n=1 Tax=Eretmocerus hayati TaxID=131215 RepID=A0ACC2PQC9_9HYME|nr:hypothetical protein QAD02_021588 [Eretmocerus hayati]